MDWLYDVQQRLCRKNQVLFVKDSPFLADLYTLIQAQTHRTLVLWAFDFAEETVQLLQGRYPMETRLEAALSISRDWAAGKVKMPLAQHAILQAHAVAKEVQSAEDVALCHAVGQACAVVHTPGHTLGFPLYELTALVRRYGLPGCKDAIEARKQDYIERIFVCSARQSDPHYEWAPFLREN